jgi:uncharacterized membrane protein YvbJ
MLICTACGHENSDGDSFCGSCGRLLASGATAASATCPLCGAPNAATRTFCQSCGAELDPAAKRRGRPAEAIQQPRSTTRRGRGQMWRTLVLVCLGLLAGAGIVVLPLILAPRLPSPDDAGTPNVSASARPETALPAAGATDAGTSPAAP